MSKKIVQISDSHLFGDKDLALNRANSYLNLKNILNHVKGEKPELIILSGDLSQDCTEQSYRNLADLLKDVGVKYYLMPGNHDDANLINKVFGLSWVKDKADYSVKLDNWLLYMLDTSVYPDVNGKLFPEQLINFENIINKNKNIPMIVFMHHHPIPVSSAWIDAMGLKDSNAFNNIVKSNSQIRAVLFGHIHQVFEKTINSTFYASAPSTCYQTKPNSEVFAVEKLVPGYRIIELSEDKFNSEVVWVK